MNINENLLDRVLKAKQELMVKTPIVQFPEPNRSSISLFDWFYYIRTTPRVAGEIELKAFNDSLKKRGII